MKLFMSMTKNILSNWYTVSRVIFNTLFNIIHVCRSQYVLQNFIFSDLGNFQSKVFISYFSYHKPIVSFTIQMTMSHSKIYQSNLCTIIIKIYCKCYYFMDIEQKKIITYYEPCLNEVFTSAM